MVAPSNVIICQNETKYSEVARDEELGLGEHARRCDVSHLSYVSLRPEENGGHLPTLRVRAQRSSYIQLE